MAWYRTGTVTVTNGSATIAGAGTDFVSNTSPGEAFLGPDGRDYEVAAIVSATQLTLATPYMGASAGAQGYALMPTQSFARDLALGAAQLLNTFAAVRDGIGQGLIADGSAATPALRFVADQDTGIYRVAANALGLVAGGVARAYVDQNGLSAAGNVYATANEFPTLDLIRSGVGTWHIGGSGSAGDNSLTFRLNAAQPALTIDTAGSLLVGATSGTSHTIIGTNSANGAAVIRFGQAGSVTMGAFYVVDFNGVEAASAANAALKLGRSSTGRSLNASGTINASGADYAEYIAKAAGCGTIAPGDVAGVDASGHLTRTWADAVAFVVKSTDPAYVGGDSWAAHLAPRPEQGEEEADSAFAARLAAWDAQLEAERVKVDRIAFAGQVPVNISGTASPGDYLIAAADGTSIQAVAIAAADITFDQYRRRLGRVWAIRGGRPWIDVQHG